MPFESTNRYKLGASVPTLARKTVLRAVCDAAETLVGLGQAVEQVGRFRDAIAAYDKAIRSLGPLASTDPNASFDLAVAWMNRGNALQKCADPASLAHAVSAYETTICLLADTPTSDKIRRTTLGAAWLNCAGVLLTLGRFQDAARAYEQSVAILVGLQASDAAHGAHLLGAAWMMRAVVALETKTDNGAADAVIYARQALAILRSLEASASAVADVTLKAYRILCEALGRRLMLVGADAALYETLLSEATDAAEAALQRVLGWSMGKVRDLELFGVWFFRFGSSLYAEYQPQFLAEFVMEYLPNGGTSITSEWSGLAVNALARSRTRLHSLLFADPKSTEAEQWLLALYSLMKLETALASVARAELAK
jgi:tetratricopeptide (TPR) repeat protein